MAMPVLEDHIAENDSVKALGANTEKTRVGATISESRVISGFIRDSSHSLVMVDVSNEDHRKMGRLSICEAVQARTRSRVGGDDAGNDESLNQTVIQNCLDSEILSTSST